MNTNGMVMVYIKSGLACDTTRWLCFLFNYIRTMLQSNSIAEVFIVCWGIC